MYSFAHNKKTKILSSVVEDVVMNKEKMVLTGHEDYYHYMATDPSRVVLFHMMDEIFSDTVVREVFLNKFNKIEPIRILVCGSVTSENIDTLRLLLQTYRPNRYKNDEIFLIEINPYSIKLHEYTTKLNCNHAKVHVDLIDMNDLPEDFENFFDIVINDFAINFNVSHEQNQKTLQNIHKALNTCGICILSLVTDHNFDFLDGEYNFDDSSIPENIKNPKYFVSEERLKRVCWTRTYYNNLIDDFGFYKKAFGISHGIEYYKNVGICYRRYLLTKSAELINMHRSFGLKVGDSVFVDSRTYEVYIKDKKNGIVLSEKQYQLIKFFIENEGKILSRDKIAMVLWGAKNKDKYAKLTVDKHVSRLRDKLGLCEKSQKCITTVRGKGFVYK